MGDKDFRCYRDHNFSLALVGHWNENSVLDIGKKDQELSGLVQKRFIEREQACLLRSPGF